MLRIPFISCLCAILFVLTVLPEQARAHRVNIFAVVENGMVRVDCYYSKSRRVKDGKVAVLDAATGATFLSGVTDAEGNWSFPVPEAARAVGHDLKLVLEAGEGHRAEWIVEAKEFAAASTASASAPPTVKEVPAAPSEAGGASPSATSLAAVPSVSRAELEAVVEQAVERALESRLAPIRRMLTEEREKGPGLTEIVGGVGWIIGLFGMAAWARSRR